VLKKRSLASVREYIEISNLIIIIIIIIVKNDGAENYGQHHQPSAFFFFSASLFVKRFTSRKELGDYILKQNERFAREIRREG
jgi:Zn-dependent peptidase ImmA (M78 family)